MADRLNGEQLEQLMRQHAAALELFAAQWTAAPEDCVQDAFIQLMRQPSVPDRLVGWLYRVVRNRAVSMQRSWWRRRRRETAFVAARPPWFTSSTLSQPEVDELTAALQAIPTELREVIVARIWGGMSFEQISHTVGASVSTVYRRYQTGLSRIRQQLEPPCPTSTPSIPDSAKSNAG